MPLKVSSFTELTIAMILFLRSSRLVANGGTKKWSLKYPHKKNSSMVAEIQWSKIWSIFLKHSILVIYTVLLDFKIIYFLLLFSYIVLPNSLVHCIFTLQEDVVSNFFRGSNFSFVPILDLISNLCTPSVKAIMLYLISH